VIGGFGDLAKGFLMLGLEKFESGRSRRNKPEGLKFE
jgi:hypothetical protein